MSKKDNAGGIPPAYFKNISIKSAVEYSEKAQTLLKNKPVGVALPKNSKVKPILFFSISELLKAKEDDYEVKYISSPEEGLEEIFELKPYQDIVKTHQVYFNYDKQTAEFDKIKIPTFCKKETTVEEIVNVTKQYTKLKPEYRRHFTDNFKINYLDGADILIKGDIVYNNKSNIVSINPNKKKQILKRRIEISKSKRLQNIVIEKTTFYRNNKYNFGNHYLPNPLDLEYDFPFIRWRINISRLLNTYFLSKRKNYSMIEELKEYSEELTTFIQLFDIPKIEDHKLKRNFIILTLFLKRINKYING